MQFSGIIRAWKGRSNSTENPSCAGPNSEWTLTSAFSNNLFYSRQEHALFLSCMLVPLVFSSWSKVTHVYICDILQQLICVCVHTYICGTENYVSVSQLILDVLRAELISQKPFQRNRLFLSLLLLLFYSAWAERKESAVNTMTLQARIHISVALWLKPDGWGWGLC